MEEKFEIGQFGKFTWKRPIRIKIAGKMEEYDAGFRIEGAMIKDMDRSSLWLLGTDGQSYIAPKKAVTFEPMKIRTELYEKSIL